MVKTAYAGHVNSDGNAAGDGIADDDGNSVRMWSAFRSWMTADAEWELMMGDLGRVLAVNFVPLNHLPRVVSIGRHVVVDLEGVRAGLLWSGRDQL